MYPDKLKATTLFIQNVTPEVSEAAIEGLKNEVLHLITNTFNHNLQVLHIDQGQIDSIQFGSEGQKWRLMHVAEFMERADVVIDLKQRLQDYLNESACDGQADRRL